MSLISISESENNINNLLYIQNDLTELLSHGGCSLKTLNESGRYELLIEIPDYYCDIIGAEIIDRVSEILVVSYKYNYFKSKIKISGLNGQEREILYASLIAADFEDDKKYAFERIKSFDKIAIDGIYNFRLKSLRKKWEDVVSYVPTSFLNTQLKEFIAYLLENKSKKVYVENGKVYDNHYKRLIRSELLTGRDDLKIIREVLISNCGIINLSGNVPKDDEFYLREYYGDKITFSDSFFS